MSDVVSVFNFSGIYDEESFYREDKGSSFSLIDCRGISGTNCMCDDMAIKEIREKIRESSVSCEAVHFIDSGNYHYMSAILTETINEPFSLVVLDHHPDMQPPMFGDILSCGGWVLKVLDGNDYVRDVHVIGADRGLIDKLFAEDRERVSFYDVDENCAGDSIDKVCPKYPVYLSIDKDVLSRDELITNWDQGDMRSERLFDFVRKLFSENRVIGVDICGECAPDQEGINIPEAIRENDEFNSKLLDIIQDSIKRTGR